MRARDLVFGREKLRAGWRVLLFFVLAVTLYWIVGSLAAPFVNALGEGPWGLTVASGSLVLALLAASYLMMRGVERRRFAALGLPLSRETAAGLLKGAVIGGGFIALLVALLTAVGWLRPRPDAGTFLGWLEHVADLAVMLAVAASAEELLYRGYPFQVLVEGMGPGPAVVLTSVLFAAFHVFNPEVGFVALLNIGLAGVLMAGAYLRTRSLWVAIGLHWAWNWVMAAVFDLPVSGLRFDVPGYDTVDLGPDLATGGAFGPEGGLITTLLAVPLIVWVYRTSWLAISPAIATLRPLGGAEREGDVGNAP